MKSFLVGSTWSYWRSDKQLEIKYFRAQVAIATKRLLQGEKLINSTDKYGYHYSSSLDNPPKIRSYAPNAPRKDIYIIVKPSSHQRHNDHNHNHKHEHNAVMSFMSQWECQKRSHKHPYDQHNHNHKKMIDNFLMIITMSLAMTILLFFVVGTRKS